MHTQGHARIRTHTTALANTHAQDEVTRYRSMLRSQNLFNKNHSVPHNIITGEVRHCPGTLLPAAPVPPPHAANGRSDGPGY